MSRFLFQGTESRVYPSYVDGDAGTTLVAAPGGTYEVAGVDGAPVPPADGRWAPAAKPAKGGAA